MRDFRLYSVLPQCRDGFDSAQPFKPRIQYFGVVVTEILPFLSGNSEGHEKIRKMVKLHASFSARIFRARTEEGRKRTAPFQAKTCSRIPGTSTWVGMIVTCELVGLK